MRFICVSILLFTFLNCFSQETIALDYERLINSNVAAGNEYLLPIDFCFHSPAIQSDCPFCNCNSLDTLKMILLKNPKLKIEVISNSDYRGKAKANLKWSRQLSNSIKSYLVKNGIDELRVKATGMGECSPYKFVDDTKINEVTIKAGTVANETYCNTITSRETKEKVIALNRRIIIKVL